MKLPNVLATDHSRENEITLTLEIVAELEVFSGHFPGNPILPGVVQIDWAVRFAALYFDTKKLSAPILQVKFRNPIRPSDPLSLTLKLDKTKGQLSFSYQSGDKPFSSGQLKLGDDS